MKKILVVGDSFSSIGLAREHGWVRLLADSYTVTNVSSPGIGEYKILKNLEDQKLDQYDYIIVSHTSPNKVYSKENLLYPSGHLYRGSDLIFADVESKLNTSNFAKSVYDYFCQIFDQDYYKFVHNKCCEEIDQLTKNYPVIHMTNFDWQGLYQFDNLINFYSLWVDNKGPYNHYNQEANQTIFKTIENIIQ